jgi:hypothetical protein
MDRFLVASEDGVADQDIDTASDPGSSTGSFVASMRATAITSLAAQPGHSGRPMVGLAVALAAVGLAGSGMTAWGAGSGRPSGIAPSWASWDAPGSTVIVRGKEYTCAEITGGGAEGSCDPVFQSAVHRWGQALDAYVTSGALGPLGNEGGLMPVVDVATFGLAACIIADRGDDSQVFIHYVAEFYPDESGSAMLPLWFGAGQFLCPDAFARASFAPEVPVTLDGTRYTCAVITRGATGGKCDPLSVWAIDRWGQALDAFVTSEEIRPLWSQDAPAGSSPRPSGGYWLPIQEVAYLGLGACIIADRSEGPTEFITFYLHDSSPSQLEETVVPIWAGASHLLCPDVSFATELNWEGVAP